MSRLPIFFDTKTDAKVTVAAVDLSGKPVGDTAVVVSLLREQWVSVDSRTRRGTWTRREIPVAEWNVRTSSAAPLPITVRDGGSYILRAVAGDVAGRRTRTEQQFYALGPGVSSWMTSTGNQIELTPERETWKPGETARILIHSPWPHATALVTVEREGIRSHRSFTVTLHAGCGGGADHRGRCAERLRFGPAGQGSDHRRPRGRRYRRRTASYRIGYTELTVDDSSKRLRVDVAADREEYRPRQPVSVSVAVAAPGGKPARAEVTLWAMDYGLLSLTDYKTPDVLKQIYSPKALQVITSDSRKRLLSRRPAGAPSTDDDVINTMTSSRL